MLKFGSRWYIIDRVRLDLKKYFVDPNKSSPAYLRIPLLLSVYYDYFKIIYFVSIPLIDWISYGLFVNKIYNNYIYFVQKLT